MNRFIFNRLAVCLAVLWGLLPARGETPAEMPGYGYRVERYRSDWDRLVPRYVKLQTGGLMGAVSVGTGWNYGHDHWETDLILGLIPKYSDDHARVSFTVKQNYYPWKVQLGNSPFSFEPLSCSFFVNVIMDRDYWVSQFDKYPNGYYWFSTRVRLNLGLGQRWTLRIPETRRKFHRSLSFFYEFSTCDMYVTSAVTNRYISLWDILRLSLGIKFQIL